jgi:enediyne biosynthesis protein E2
MATILGTLRKYLLSPPLDDVLFAKRGFDVRDDATQRLLETSGRHLIVGFEFAIEAANPQEAVERIEMLESQFQGFAYEGAAMAFSIRDAIRPGRRGHLTGQFLSSGRGAAHIYMAYIGIGFALARLPERLWPRAVPDISKLPDHPALSWFIWDGYGFHKAFFDPLTWIERRRSGEIYRWFSTPAYIPRAIDQGIGRAIWFYHDADVERIAATVAHFPKARQADLWSGVSLAATYAGGIDQSGLRRLLEFGACYRSELALGAVLAAKARVLAGVATTHTEAATRILCDRSAQDAAEITNVAAVDLPPDGSEPAYEVFRRRIVQLATTKEETRVDSGITDPEQVLKATLEAFSDTIVPGEKRGPDDVTVAGAAPGPGAVAAGALELMNTREGGMAPMLVPLAELLNVHASVYAAEQGLELNEDLPSFVALPFEHRTALVMRLCDPSHPEKEAWVGLALFANMAFDTAAHMSTRDAIAAGHPGLKAMGFASPDPDGLWRFPHYSYRRPLAHLHPNTTPTGSPA